jgi:hypothetical protein
MNSSIHTRAIALTAVVAALALPAVAGATSPHFTTDTLGGNGHPPAAQGIHIVTDTLGGNGGAPAAPDAFERAVARQGYRFITDTLGGNGRPAPRCVGEGCSVAAPLAAVQSPNGFDWGDAGIGAGVALGALALLAVSLLLLKQLRRRRLYAGLSMGVVGVLVAASAIAAATASAAPATRGFEQTSCARQVSLLLWPKGYRAYPAPTFEVFRGGTGPFGVPNLVAYATAAKDAAALGFGRAAANINPYCADSGSATSTAAPVSTVTTAGRIACSFPKPVAVEITNLAADGKRVRLSVAGEGVVAQATVGRRASRLTYATRFCSRKLQLVEPTS